ncbi:MAG: cysteine desulfurase IscS [Pseudomonadota bacterium]|jgi:cysteine desulfurase
MGLKFPIYLDHHSTTMVDPEVFKLMVPYFTEHFGNPSNRNHSFGREAERAIGCARKTIATLLGASEKEILFTSGATESNNLAILGLASKAKSRGNHIITTSVEHKSVLEACLHLERQGYSVTYLPVNQHGQVSAEQVQKALRPTTILVSIMMANNEIGSINPIQDIGHLCRKEGVFLHTDAVQAAGLCSINVDALGVDLLSLSAHKIYGPKGVGALYASKRYSESLIAEQIHGGGQEQGLRSGTHNVPGIIGFGKAAELALKERGSECARIIRLRDRLWRALNSQLDQVYLNGHPTQRLANNLNVSFAGIVGEAIMKQMPEVAVSSGSSCSSASHEPSYVLRQIGLSRGIAHSTLRFGLGRYTTEEEVDYVAAKVVSIVKTLRERSIPVYEFI